MLELVLVTMCVGADRRMLMIMSEQFTDKRVLIILTVRAVHSKLPNNMVQWPTGIQNYDDSRLRLYNGLWYIDVQWWREILNCVLCRAVVVVHYHSNEPINVYYSFPPNFFFLCRPDLLLLDGKVSITISSSSSITHLPASLLQSIPVIPTFPHWKILSMLSLASSSLVPRPFKRPGYEATGSCDWNSWWLFTVNA